MEARPIRQYMACAEHLVYLKQVSPGEPILDRRLMPNRGLLEHLDDFLRGLEELNLTISLRSEEGGILKTLCNNLRGRSDTTATDLESREYSGSSAETGTILDAPCPVSHQEAEQIRETATRIEPILRAESLSLLVYEVETDRRFDVEKLLNEVGAFFSRGVFECLPRIAQWDFVEAGKALAFNVPVGAAMLSFRACEAVLRGYYYLLRHTKPEPRLTFGQLRRELESWDKAPQRYSHTLDYLGNVVSLRNRTMHPQRRYVIEEAESLFRICASVCAPMIEDLRNAEAGQQSVLNRLNSEETERILFEWIQTVDSPLSQ